MRESILIVLMLLNINTFAQTDYHSIEKQDLYTYHFDENTEKIFVYVKPTAKIYYKRSDILSYLDIYYQGNSIKNGFRKVLVDTLKSSEQKIEITDLDFSYTNKERGKFIRKHKIDLKRQKINKVFEQIGFDLIFQGKFMVYSLSEKKFISSGLKAFKTKGLYGTEYLELYLPNNSKFYSIITALGE